jgi:hypothetical protein
MSSDINIFLFMPLFYPDPVLIACYHDVYLPFTLVAVFSALIWSVLDVEP